MRKIKKFSYILSIATMLSILEIFSQQDYKLLRDIAANANQAKIVKNNTYTRLNITNMQLYRLEAKIDQISIVLEVLSYNITSDPSTVSEPPLPPVRSYCSNC